MAPVKAPVPGPSSTTVTGSLVGKSATIMSARAFELGETAPTVRGLFRNLLKISIDSRTTLLFDASSMLRTLGLTPALERAPELGKQSFRSRHRTVQRGDLQAVHPVGEPAGDIDGHGKRL